MRILSIDTALNACSVSIVSDNVVLADIKEPLERGHAERIAPVTAQALQQSGIRAVDLDRIGVVVGPGSFAGVRVGLAFARAFAIGSSIKVIGVTSLEALAARRFLDEPKTHVAAVVNARRGQVYSAVYDSFGDIVIEPFAATPEDALNKLTAAARDKAVDAVGDGVSLLGRLPENLIALENFEEIDAKVVARLVGRVETPPSTPPAPVYLRPPDAKPATPSAFAGLLDQAGL